MEGTEKTGIVGAEVEREPKYWKMKGWAICHDVNAIYHSILPDKEPERMSEVIKDPGNKKKNRLLQGSTIYSIQSLQIIEGEDAEKIKEINDVMSELHTEKVRLVRSAKTRRARISDFHKQGEAVVE